MIERLTRQAAGAFACALMVGIAACSAVSPKPWDDYAGETLRVHGTDRSTAGQVVWRALKNQDSIHDFLVAHGEPDTLEIRGGRLSQKTIILNYTRRDAGAPHRIQLDPGRKGGYIPRAPEPIARERAKPSRAGTTAEPRSGRTLEPTTDDGSRPAPENGAPPAGETNRPARSAPAGETRPAAVAPADETKPSGSAPPAATNPAGSAPATATHSVGTAPAAATNPAGVPAAATAPAATTRAATAEQRVNCPIDPTRADCQALCGSGAAHEWCQ